MKFFQTQLIRQIDRMTIEKEPISSFNLMKRASLAFFNRLLPHLPQEGEVVVVAGAGNNGGDAMVVARLLMNIGIVPKVFLISPKGNLSEDCQKAYEELAEKTLIHKITHSHELDDEDIFSCDLLIDGLFGSGLNRPLEGIFALTVERINHCKGKIFSIDLPSGLFGEDNSKNDHNHIVNASHTFSFQTPKPSFFMAESERHLGEWEILDIQLHPKALSETESPFYYTESSDISFLKRSRFGHKGTFGHALIIAGSFGMMGAAVLATKAALRTGCGLTTIHTPQCGYTIMQISIPEAIVSLDAQQNCFSDIPDISKYTAIGVGPGLGCEESSINGLKLLLEKKPEKLVLDADALNILSKNRELWELLPPKTILTPHPKEFERLIGMKKSAYECWLTQMEISQKKDIIIILKGAYTSISLPDGTLHINSTGNSGMATAGSGDTLTGILTSLLAQGYTPEKAAILGVWLHGKAGDLALSRESEESLLASDIIENIGNVYKTHNNIV